MLLVKNRKAFLNHELVEKFVAGISLTGHEVKAIREGNVNFEGSYITFDDSTIVLTNLHIGRYSKQSQDVNELSLSRPRNLLLNKNEIAKIRKELAEKGKTAVPLALLLHNGHIKLELAVVKGRKAFSKKNLEKEKQVKKDLLLAVKDSRYEL